MKAPVFSLSTAARQTKRSVMRDLISLVNQPDVISFAGGLPAADGLPLDDLRACFDAVLARDGARALQYGPPFGPLREWVAEAMRARGVPCAVENVFITNGAQQGLAVAGRLLLEPGAPAVVEALTFTGITQVMQAHGAKVRPAALDVQAGVLPEAFEQALRGDGQPAKLAAVIPDFHNPVGCRLPLAARQAIAAAAARTGVPVIEDDCYSALRFAGEALPPIKAFDEAGLVLYVSSFSKILAPAARLGWIVAPAELMPQLTVLRESLDLESSQLMQRAVAEYLARGYLPAHLARLNATHQARERAMTAALERELAGLATWNAPEGGLFMWATLAGGVDASDVFQRAIKQGVAFIPGTHFSVEGGYQSAMRLNFSNASPEQINEGMRRLAVAIQETRAL